MSLVAVSRAPIEKINAYKSRMGWRVPWYSSFDSDFNYDFHVTLNDAVAPVEYNYKGQSVLARRCQAGQASSRWTAHLSDEHFV